MKDFPRITVITPSFNQAKYLAECIESVLGQNYPNLEYMVLDGGSTDESVEVIKRYEKHINFWCSEKDGGQAAAINRGFEKATGDILAWLNSDDYYLPGTLRYIAEQMSSNKPEVLIGNCFHFVENTHQCYGSDIVEKHSAGNLVAIDYIIQPSSFITRNAWKQVGALQSNYGYVFDWDWYIRAIKSGVTFKTTPRFLSAYRIHEAHKTGTGGEPRIQEIRDIYKAYDHRLLELYDACGKYWPAIMFVERWARRTRLSKFFNKNAILRTFLPFVFRGISLNDIEGVVDVYRYNH